MQVRQFKVILAQISSALGAARAADARSAIQSLDAALVGRDSDTVEQVARDLEAPEPSATAHFVHELAAVGLDEARFLTLLGQIEKAKLKKPELQDLVKCYVGRFDSKMSGKQLVDRIKLEFYERMYEEASHKMAVKATPF
jgi:hypothetical protein